MRVNGVIFDTLLSITLVWAAWRLLSLRDESSNSVLEAPETRVALPVGGSIGLVSGMVGVGGGIFLSPIILLKKWASPKAAAATAALFIWVNSAAGIAGAGLSEQLDIDVYTLIPFACAVLLGGVVGSRYGAKVAPQLGVRRLLVVVLIVAAARRVLSVLGIW